MLIDFVPDVAGVSLAESGGFVKAPGGAPANVACAVSKLGGSSAFVGKVYLIAIPPPPPLRQCVTFARSLLF
jgi:fructokinase